MSINHADRELHEAIQALLDETSDPDSHLADIARQAVSRGYGNLNLEQRAAYDALVDQARQQLKKWRASPTFLRLPR